MTPRIWQPKDFDMRICLAKSCPEEADGYWGLCQRHARQLDAGTPIQRHVNPPQGQPVLWCSACRTDKPDEAFPLHGDKATGFRSPRRRNRHWCCTDCISKGKNK